MLLSNASKLLYSWNSLSYSSFQCTLAFFLRTAKGTPLEGEKKTPHLGDARIKKHTKVVRRESSRGSEAKEARQRKVWMFGFQKSLTETRKGL